jgi:hypothetical protein
MASYDVSVDTDRNRMHMTFEGMLDEEQAEAALAEVEAALSDLEPGFGLVNDISAFRPVSQTVTDRIEDGKQLLVERGATAAVRVTGESVIGKMQFERVGEGEESYHVATAETVEEAEELLAEFEG